GGVVLPSRRRAAHRNAVGTAAAIVCRQQLSARRAGGSQRAVAGDFGAALARVRALGFSGRVNPKGACMQGATSDVWEVMSTARTIRRFNDEPVDDATLERCLQAAMWAPSGANAQAWRFVVLRSPEQRAVVAKAAARALEVIEPVYGMSRPPDDDDSRRARTNRATYELHDRAGEFTSVLFVQKHFPTASELLLGGSIFPAMQNFLLAARR